jgi:septum formation topological specificity factor MinE
VPKILEELKFKIIPVIINQLQFTEDKIDVSENKMSSINIE